MYLTIFFLNYHKPPVCLMQLIWKKIKCKTRCESRDIDENKIVQSLGETFGMIRRLATEWGGKPFYDVTGHMAGSNKRYRQRWFEPSQEWFLKKMINDNVSSDLILLWFASVYGAASYIPNCVSHLVLRLQKVLERWLCKTYLYST